MPAVTEEECIELADRIEEVCVGKNILVVEAAVLLMLLRTIELIEDPDVRNGIILRDITVLNTLMAELDALQLH